MTDTFHRKMFLYLDFICIVLFIGLNIQVSSEDTCTKETCAPTQSMYSQKYNDMLKIIQDSVDVYKPCLFTNCSCFLDTMQNDLSPYHNGITQSMLNSAASKGTVYKIVSGKLYRMGDCMFPARCGGVEYFLLKLVDELPDLELVLNTRDWPQVMKYQGDLIPVFSFSKTSDYIDIMYPAWAFWAGGPAIKLYPRGLGDWDRFRLTLNEARKKTPWKKKKPMAFFRGSRTHNERDSLVLLSRRDPTSVDAAYTKNQAWKSNKDTLDAPPVEEVSLEEHCNFKYLFNFRGVAASFRFKYLFLCRSLVFNVDDQWLEFFYPSLKPWVHYVPVKSGVTQEEIRSMLEFFRNHDEVAVQIAQRGRDFVWNHLRNEDVLCYWKQLLVEYSKLLMFKPKLVGTEVNITNDK